MKGELSSQRKPGGRQGGYRLEGRGGLGKQRGKKGPVLRLAVADPAKVPVTEEAVRALRPKHGATLDTRILAVLVRGLREMQGLSQGQLARLCGLRRQTIGQLEQAEHDPRMGTVRVICAAVRAKFSALTDRADDFSEVKWQF